MVAQRRSDWVPGRGRDGRAGDLYEGRGVKALHERGSIFLRTLHEARDYFPLRLSSWSRLLADVSMRISII